ncbi:hypothetical protein DDB_G0291770 [Dictyostelium discoideum AX4]|uniref:25S rRNA (uridine-N(3))-methyltransferase BMT5-like domain-containing protein n=1 Tax=Dictyostelium discoideum TaxID=44689 RepID=Q54E93_DICDI|nr:hypothetical protein DDB_G0291770 [Dictyostelium discoideum AX4]EAL61581.1 hypothetical protein DDB_G0291770 [Dictyostelium discoideum AX4]|eukprot:XP_629969.1 hypothetical protein DDB_G0291770 [Dictyostelium discoideum AX4]
MYTPQPNKKKISEISKRVSKSETKAPLSKCKAERHHKILFVGEGNFSFSTSLLEKHNQNHHTNDGKFLKITASDLYISQTVYNKFKVHKDVLIKTGVTTYGCCEDNVKKCDNCLLTIKNIEFLIISECTVIFGLDATKIHESNERYSKIYWSMPHDRSSFMDPSLPNLISDFCLSCSKVQRLGDKVHLIISQTKKDDPTYHTIFQQGIILSKVHLLPDTLWKKEFFLTIKDIRDININRRQE